MVIMRGLRLWPTLLTLSAFIALAVQGNAGPAQEKKDAKRFRSSIIDLTDKAPSDWLLKEAKIGEQILSGRDYEFAELPDEIKGGTLLQRPAGAGGDDYHQWLPNKSLTALKDGTVYAIILWKCMDKEMVDEVAFTKLEREDWKEVKGATETTFPNGEDWRWKAYKKNIKKGDIILQLKALKWGKWGVLFVFKG
ncbi:unnamed protein product [Gemmata massiliana]|uniref:Uncharacterized protein n=1 Tax=Gemmata massiliana TaxID=1210884 RepID=A0A6P2DIQ7_9BACT|nr:hypothetical protein [Gemmata massiliana]VTS02508.1 unnamed protein product [Gemmata massiliana]